MRVLVISGGRSPEREVSLVSGAWVRDTLKASGHQVLDVRIGPDGDWSLSGEPLEVYPGRCPWRLAAGGGAIPFDLVFPVLHGPLGEDGTIQGACETAGWPYAGVPVMGCSVAMDKQTMRLLARDAGIPMLPWVFTDGGAVESFADTALELGGNLFVKPSRMGSSVGISRASGRGELMDALALASGYDHRIVVEKALDSPREMEVSVLGCSAGVECSIPGEIIPGGDWYDYRAKYQCGESRLLIPAPVSRETAQRLRLLAQTAFRLLGGRGYARVDFLVDGNSGDIFFNEVNTIPGFTSISMFPKLWDASGVPPALLMERIMAEAMERFEAAPGRLA
jgi:D-alanine-D-alanine ligase